MTKTNKELKIHQFKCIKCGVMSWNFIGYIIVGKEFKCQLVCNTCGHTGFVSRKDHRELPTIVNRISNAVGYVG